MQYTTREQGRRLVELGLDLNTSDLFYDDENHIQIGIADQNGSDKYAWSSDALLKVIPCPYQMTRKRDGTVQFMLLTVLRHDTYNTELEAVYTMVVWLLENNLLDEQKLRNYGSKRAD